MPDTVKPDTLTSHRTDCERALAILDTLGDAPLADAEESLLTAHAATCAACAAEWALAAEMARAFLELPGLECPPAVTRAVLREAQREAEREAQREAERREVAGLAASGWGRRLVRYLTELLPGPGPGARPSAPAWRPLVAGALLVALTAVGLYYQTRPTPPPAFTAAEVARAQDDLERVFSYLGKIGADTGVALREEVVDHVLQPTRRAFGSPVATRASQEGD